MSYTMKPILAEVGAWFAKRAAPIGLRRCAVLSALSLCMVGCAHERPQLPAADLTRSCTVPAIRLLPSELDPERASDPSSSFAALVRLRLSNRRAEAERPQVLMLSGGSQNGAFGAGFFRGMTRTGGVPDYDVVTAVSTGALQSTFVFLANRDVPEDRRNKYPDYMRIDRGLGDPGLSNIDDLALAYAIGSEGDLMDVGSLGLANAALDGSLANFGPLRSVAHALVTPDTLRAVAKEFDGGKGRSLFVGVTDLDDGYGYAIDLTRLAWDAVQLNDVAALEAARECYIETLIASSSVPPGVPPVTLRTDKGATHLFMDGGARYGVFYDQLNRAAQGPNGADVTLIVNGGLYGKPWLDKHGKPIEKWSVVSFGLRAVDVLQNQVYRLSVDNQERWAVKNGTLRMAFISNENLQQMKDDPGDWTDASGISCKVHAERDRAKAAPLEFHPEYMRCLIAYGEARAGLDRWNKVLK